MISLLVGVGVGVGVIVSGAVYEVYFDNCRGGHVYGDWEPTDRIKSVPHRGKDVVMLEREHERTCQREGCSHTESEYQTVNDVGTWVLDALATSTDVEPRYRCPICKRLVRDSRREVRHESNGYVTEVGIECPECERKNPSSYWTYKPRESITLGDGGE